MDHDDIEGGRFGRAGFDHALEFRTAIVGGGSTRFDEGVDQIVAACGAIGLALLALIGNGYVMFGLTRRRDTELESRALHDTKLRLQVRRTRVRGHGVSPVKRLCAVATGRYRVVGRSVSGVNPKAS